MTMSNVSWSISRSALRAAGGHGAVVADPLQAFGHGLGVGRVVVDDQHANAAGVAAATSLSASGAVVARDAACVAVSGARSLSRLVEADLAMLPMIANRMPNGLGADTSGGR